MAIISPASYNWLLEDRKGGVGGGGGARWTAAENKLFENALAVFDRETPDRWHNVAAMIPGKSVDDVITKYRELEYDVSNIEAGLVPIPGYSTTSAFTLDWVTGQPFSLGPKRSSSARPLEQERKKGVPWTEEEHKLFLMGLKKYGKGDWRNISRNYVVTRTPTQVASHAQKYFIRQLSGGKDKRRASIHDITTNNLNEAMAPTRTPSPDTKRAPSPDKPRMAPAFHWNQPLSSGGGAGGFHLTNGNTFVPNPYGVIGSYGLGPQSMVFQMQFTHQYPHG